MTGSNGSYFPFLIPVIFMILLFSLRMRGRRGWGGGGGGPFGRRPWGGPWGGGGGPWGGGGGPWGGGGNPLGGGPATGPSGGPGTGPGSTGPAGGPGSGGGAAWGGSTMPSSSWPGLGQGNLPPVGGTGVPGKSVPGSGGPAAGGDAGWAAGGGPAGGSWASPGGGPAGGGWASTGSGGDAGVPAGSGRGAGERLSGIGSAWPDEDSREWMNDPRPAAASIPGEIFPERHAREVEAATSPVDKGLAAIKAHDPNFDLEQFTQQVQRVFFIVEEAWSERKPEMARRVMADDLWQAHRAQIQGYVDAHKRNRLDYLSVSNIWPVAAHSDARFDTITMRVVAVCADYDVDDSTGRTVRGAKEVKPWEEDWTFQRSSSAATKAGGTALGSTCPNCGAPLDVDLAGTCRYCKAQIMSGAYDWVLARISQVG